jgi:iron complex outermembrane receptor protein
LPASFAPDTSKNYELGAKGDVPGHAISFDASLYRIDWNNIQLGLTNSSGLSYYSNGSRARSQGAELSIETKPLSGLTVGGWVAFNDAKLTENLPTGAAFGLSGDRLPFSSRFSSNVSAEDDFALAGHFTGYVGGSVSYVGERQGEFTSTSLRQELPAYARTDARLGVKNESWNIGAFANNITNKRGELSGGLGSAWPYAFHIIQPRTIGLTVSKAF